MKREWRHNNFFSNQPSFDVLFGRGYLASLVMTYTTDFRVVNVNEINLCSPALPEFLRLIIPYNNVRQEFADVRILYVP